MNIFDILGPVMVGPSSSHTAGVVRIGNCLRHIIAEEPTAISIRFHGSFATTYKGHGSDKAIIAGLLDFKTDDERVKDSLEIAKNKGISVEFKKIELPPSAHPNTLVADITSETKRLRAIGESVGGGNFVIKRLNDTDVEFTGQFDTLVIDHRDVPGAVALVTSLLSAEKINIAGMRVFRSRKGGNSIMVIEADGGAVTSSLAELIDKLPNINSATFIPGLKN